jgi:DNA modification methylase
MKLQPENFEIETSTVWSFKRRGNWATHKSNFRGNWAPQIVRNIILRYSNENDCVLDPMVGGGTTLIECKLTNRHCLGVDINPKAIEISKNAINFNTDNNVKIKVQKGDARDLKFLDNNSIDLVATHPPYANIISYSNGKIREDLSNISNLEKFYKEIGVIAKELYRVLKPGKYCSILIGDTRRKKYYIPMAFNVMQKFLDAGFLLKEDIIKHQHNTKTEGFWKERSKKYNFLLIMHEHLFVFKKPNS